jgi:hypothetical protein
MLCWCKNSHGFWKVNGISAAPSTPHLERIRWKGRSKSLSIIYLSFSFRWRIFSKWVFPCLRVSLARMVIRSVCLLLWKSTERKTFRSDWDTGWATGQLRFEFSRGRYFYDVSHCVQNDFVPQAVSYPVIIAISSPAAKQSGR